MCGQVASHLSIYPAALEEIVKQGNFGALNTDSRNVLFISGDDCPDEESVKQRVATLVTACLNSRASNRTGVIIVGVDPDDVHVSMSHVPHWQAIEQTLCSYIVRQGEEKDQPMNFSTQELSLVKISPVQLQAGRVILVSVHPDWNLCHQTSVYRCVSRDKNGKSKLEPVYRLVGDDHDTTAIAVSFKKVKDILMKSLSSGRK